MLLKAMALGAAGSALAGWAARDARAAMTGLAATRSSVAGAVTMEKATTLKDATGYNNFYEFGTDKDDPARLPANSDRPWTVEIEGLVNKPGRIGIDDLLKLSRWKSASTACAASRLVDGDPWVGYSLR
jgi:sulfoxide reductase catalytic subunit YedY